MNFLDVTKQYYAKLVGIKPEAFDRSTPLLIQSPKRDTVQEGYSRQHDFYCLITEQTTVASFGQRLVEHVGCIEKLLSVSRDPKEIKRQLAAMSAGIVTHNIKYVFHKFPENLDISAAIQLNRDDYDDYLQFFQILHPSANPTEWLYEYFTSLVERGYAWAVRRDNKLVTVTDAPDVPHMKNVVVEPGINTLPEYRRQGLAKVATGALIKHILWSGKVPIWSCLDSNTASRRLAESLGFKKFADLVTLSLDT